MPSSNTRTGLKLAVVVGVATVVLLVVAVAGLLWLRQPPPALEAVSPARVTPGSSLSLEGQGFAPEPGKNNVSVAGIVARVSDASQGRLEVELPDLGVAPGEERRVPIQVVVGGRSSAPFEIIVYREAPAPEPRPEPEVGDVRPSPPPPTVPSSPAELRAQKFRTVVGRARTALRQKRYAEAAKLFEQALELDRANDEAAKGRATARSELGALRRFVSGTTQPVGPAAAFPPGFEPGDDIKVQRASEPGAGIEFDVLPESVRPGVAYNVKVYLRNRGKQDVRIKTLTVAASLNGQGSRSQVRARLKKVPRGQIGLLTELPGVWKDDTDSWSIAVTVETDERHTYTNEVTWE
jgi:hypothetical protein